MKTSPLFSIRGVVVALSFWLPTIIHAGFSGPYSLEPPAPGAYSDWQQLRLFTNNWTASALIASVNTLDAPAQLKLSVPTGSLFANGLQFQTHAAAGGFVRFDSASVSLLQGAISWFRHPVGGNPWYTALDGDAQGAWQHFEFQVQVGDAFGFVLLSGGDTVGPDDPPMQTLTVSNFFAPMLPVLIEPLRLSDGGVRFTITNLIAGKTNVVAVSTNLLNWTPVLTNVPDSDSLPFTNTPSSGVSYQFYRSWQIP